MKVIFCLLLSACCFLLTQSVLASDAEDLMRSVRAGWEAADEVSEVTAVTTNSSGRAGPTQRFILWQAWKPSGKDLARIKFTAPEDQEGIQLLTLGEQQYLKPQGLRVRRVLFDKGQGGTEFAQTVFTHEDLRSLDLQTYQYSGSGTALTVVPVKPAESAYSKLEVTIDRGKLVIVSIRYFDKGGALLKTLTNGNWLEAKPGVWRPRLITMVHKTGRKTEVTIVYTSFKPLHPKIFSKAELEK